MSDPELTRAFVRQGLVSYPAALDAVEFFESQIRDALRRVLDEKIVWSTFRRATEPDGRPRAPIMGRPGAAPNRSIYAYVEGDERNGDKTWASLGLYWTPPKVKVPVVAFAHFSVGSRMVSIEHQ